MSHWGQVDFDIALRENLVRQISAALREAVPGATHAHVHVNDTEIDAPTLYASIILNSDGKRIEQEEPDALENRVINALVDDETKTSWDGYSLTLDLLRGVEMEDQVELYDLMTD